jgi:TatA/E family protein of Tat protein translocase
VGKRSRHETVSRVRRIRRHAILGVDMMVILLIVFLLFGAKKLPELARGMGRAGEGVQRRSR